MKHFAAALLVAVVALAGAAPVSADHSGYERGVDGSGPLFHWGHGHAPLVCAAPGLEGYASSAEGGWTHYGYPNGFQYRACSLSTAHISYQWGDPGSGADGQANVVHINNPNTHITARCRIIVRPGMGANRTQGVVTHELGHCLGLAHSRDAESIMAPNITDKYGSPHDATAIKITYTPHNDY